MQKLDESHCEALLVLRSEYTQVSKVQRRTSIGLHDLWIMKVGHDRGEVSTRPEEVEGTLEMVGRTSMKGIDTALMCEGT
jgi:hypothetical protein